MSDVVIGIDAATHGLGYALVTLAAEPLVADYIPLDREGSREEQILRAVERFPLDGHTIRAIVVEKVGGGRGVRSMLAVEHAASATAGILLARNPKATLFRPTPAQWRNAIGMKANATKDALRAAAHLWAPELNTDDLRTDAAEALLIAWSEVKVVNEAVASEIGATGSDLRASEDTANGAATPDSEQMELG